MDFREFGGGGDLRVEGSGEVEDRGGGQWAGRGGGDREVEDDLDDDGVSGRDVGGGGGDL